MAQNNPPDRRNSNTQLLEELEALSQTLNNTNTSSIPSTKNRRTNSLVLSRASIPPILSTGKTDHADDDDDHDGIKLNPKPRARRMSLSPWRSRPSEETSQKQQPPIVSKNLFQDNKQDSSSSEKKGLWNWKPIRVLSHIGKQKLSCLLSVEVVTVQGLPASMNGLRLSVSVRKKETKDGAVQTMPSRVSQGAADFEETLFMRCHVYCTPAGSGNPRPKFEPRPFVIHVFAVDAEELDFGRHAVDLSQLIQESIEKNFEGTRIRQWDMSYNLSGKAKGGELVMKLGFQIMEKEGGVGIYNQVEGPKSGKSKMFSPSIGRKQSKSSFSVPSPRIPNRGEAYTPSQRIGNVDLQGIDELNLDEPPHKQLASAPVVREPAVAAMTDDPESKVEDLDLPDFEVVDKGIEVQDRDGTQSEDNSDKRSVSSEVVKEIVHDDVHLKRLSELDSIAQQIKALESMMKSEKNEENDEEETESQRLDEDEDKVTREFFQMLENEDGKEESFDHENSASETADDAESKVFVPDLGKGLGCVIQTRNGGYLVSTNPFDNLMFKKDTPKLAMQISRPMVLASTESTGTELFQRMAAIGFEELSSEILSLMPMEELVGKTAEQTAFEGIASTIISGRNKEGATSSATRAITIVKSMATGMTTGRKERISSGIWNMNENPLTGDEILSCSLQKIEELAVEALKVQADITKETAPFDVSPSNITKDGSHPLTNAIPLEDWMKDNGIVTSENEHETITISVVIQMRDPLRQYEAVGGPLIALIHATSVEAEPAQEKRFKVASLNVGGLKLRSGGKKNDWDTEKQRLTAIQWLVGYGLGKAGKKGKRVMVKGPDLLWSLSSRVMADMWLKPIRNPDVKFTT